jgi:hypothetical protein
VSALPFKLWIAWERSRAWLGRVIRMTGRSRTSSRRRHKTKRVFFDLP